MNLAIAFFIFSATAVVLEIFNSPLDKVQSRVLMIFLGIVSQLIPSVTGGD